MDRVLHCGFCLSTYTLEEIGKHGLSECAPAPKEGQPSDHAGCVALELWFQCVGGHITDPWQDNVELVASKIYSGYDRLTEQDEMTEPQERQIMKAEETAERYIMVNFMKRLAFVSHITLEDLMS